MQFKMSYLSGLNELVGLTYVQNLGLLMKRTPGLYHEKLDCHLNMTNWIVINWIVINKIKDFLYHDKLVRHLTECIVT